MPRTDYNDIVFFYKVIIQSISPISQDGCVAIVRPNQAKLFLRRLVSEEVYATDSEVSTGRVRTLFLPA